MTPLWVAVHLFTTVAVDASLSYDVGYEQRCRLSVEATTGRVTDDVVFRDTTCVVDGQGYVLETRADTEVGTATLRFVYRPLHSSLDVLTP